MEVIQCGIFAIIGLNYFTECKRRVFDTITDDTDVDCVYREEYIYMSANKSLECRQCSQCPKDYGLKVRCTLYNDTVCEKCKDGYFSRNGSKHCKKCKICPDNYHIVRQCSAGQNTKCKPCKKGRYYSKIKNKCLKCHGCRPGTYVWSLCSKTSNTLCKPCPLGTFTDVYGLNMRCRPCRTCHYNEEIVKPCSSINDNICGKCKQGYFRLIASGNCGKCSECYKDFPEYTFEIDECIERGNGSINVCMPVINPPIRYNAKDESKTEKESIKKDDKPDNSRDDGNLPTTFSYLIGSAAALVIIITVLVILWICSKHHHKMKRIKEQCMVLKYRSSSEIYTLNWVHASNNHHNVLSLRSNSEPKVTPKELVDSQDDFRGRSNTYSYEVSTDLTDISDFRAVCY